MKPRSIVSSLFYTFVCLLLFASTIAQGGENNLLPIPSTWIVTVEGEPLTRTLTITGSTSEDSLEGTYGMTYGSKKPPLSISLSRQSDKITLRFTTSAGSEIVATGQGARFVGTFRHKNAEKSVTLRRVSDEELQREIADQESIKAAVVIVKPSPSVPESCAAFSGKWAGKWANGNFGTMWLWIASVDTQCNVKFAYLPHHHAPKTLISGRIENGSLSFVCSSSTGGVCEFTNHGNELWGNYMNSSGGKNNAIFDRAASDS